MDSLELKQRELILRLLNENVFEPALSNARTTKSVKTWVKNTKDRISSMSYTEMLDYFSKVCLHLTGLSARVGREMKRQGLTCFEDVEPLIYESLRALETKQSGDLPEK